MRTPTTALPRLVTARFAVAGIGVLPDYLTADFPLLERVLPGVESVEVPVFLAYPEELRSSRRVNAFRDFVQEEILAYRRAQTGEAAAD